MATVIYKKGIPFIRFAGWHCPSCGKEVSVFDKHCSKCSERLEFPRCDCGLIVYPEHYCSNCGKREWRK